MFAGGAGPSPDEGGDWSKDSRRNIEATGEFVCNLTTWDTREQMNQTAAHVAPDVDEMALAGLTQEPSQLVKPPRIAEAPVHLECRHVKSVEIPHWEEPDQYFVVFGEVIGVHIRDDLITADGLIDVGKLRPIARLGYNDYTVVNPDTIFTMIRPE
jgi:flavin reductase (DIM6/NTAB) family NADH-FMN oxidoreductase RutF